MGGPHSLTATSGKCRQVPHALRSLVGAAGDGTSCTATPDIGLYANMYETGGIAQLACDEGSNVQYPSGAPGFRHDPTNYTNTNPSLQVSLPRGHGFAVLKLHKPHNSRYHACCHSEGYWWEGRMKSYRGLKRCALCCM